MGAVNTGAFLFCFRKNIVFRIFYSFYNKKEINNVADPYDGEQDPADWNRFHHKKTDAHQKRGASGDRKFGAQCHSLFLNEGFQMFFVHRSMRKPVIQFFGTPCKTEYGYKVKWDGRKKRKNNSDASENQTQETK